VAVTSGSAERAGLRTDDTIRAAGRTPTPDPPALAAVLAAAHPGDQLTFSVTRGTQDLSAKLTLTELAAA
jgi:S1-C subfamily serine protease